MEKTNMLSLYDYLGYAAGLKLGRLVNDYAKVRKYDSKYRFIQTKGYSGYVTTYSKQFLDEFFASASLFENNFKKSLKEAQETMLKELEELNTLLNEDSFEKTVEEIDSRFFWSYMGM